MKEYQNTVFKKARYNIFISLRESPSFLLTETISYIYLSIHRWLVTPKQLSFLINLLFTCLKEDNLLWINTGIFKSLRHLKNPTLHHQNSQGFNHIAWGVWHTAANALSIFDQRNELCWWYWLYVGSCNCDFQCTKYIKDNYNFMSFLCFIFHSLGHGILKISTYYFIQNKLIKEIGGRTWPAESLLFSVLCLLQILRIFMLFQMLCPPHCISLYFESEMKGFWNIPLHLKMAAVKAGYKELNQFPHT